MINKKNIESGLNGQLVTIGRMNGDIKPGDKVYKLISKTLSSIAKNSYSTENKKISLDCTITIKKDLPISLEITAPMDLCIKYSLEKLPEVAVNQAITKERIITQFSKTGNTPFCFNNIDVILDDNLYVNIKDINKLRRNGLEVLSEAIINSSKRVLKENFASPNFKKVKKHDCKKKISLLLNILDVNTNYSALEGVDNVYIPLKYFSMPEYSNIIKIITSSFNTYIYMPSVIKGNYRNLFTNNIELTLAQYDIKGFVLSNIGTVNMLEKYKDSYEFVGNYNLNVLNSASIEAYAKLGIHTITLSPELNKEDVVSLCCTNTKTELIVYGNTPVMTTGYCLLGHSNKCYPKCDAFCKNDNCYYLKDRLNLKFRILQDNIQTVSTIYNSKITSIEHSFIDVDSVRIDILDENIFEINNIIKQVASGNRLSGKDYTNGNFIREV